MIKESAEACGAVAGLLDKPTLSSLEHALKETSESIETARRAQRDLEAAIQLAKSE